MRAIIFVAGRGLRLQQADDRLMPNCLLQFDGMSLLERHLRLSKSAGVYEVVLPLGYRHERGEAELDRLHGQPRPEIVLNPQFELGSVLSVHTTAEAPTRGGDVLLMDEDVPYDDHNGLSAPGDQAAGEREVRRHRGIDVAGVRGGCIGFGHRGAGLH